MDAANGGMNVLSMTKHAFLTLSNERADSTFVARAVTKSPG